MTILIISQIIFNLVASFAIIVVSVLISVIAYEIIKFIKSIKKLSADLREESAEIYRHLNNFFESILNLSFISRFFKKKTGKTKKPS